MRAIGADYVMAIVDKFDELAIKRKVEANVTLYIDRHRLRYMMEKFPVVEAEPVQHGQWVPVYRDGKLYGGKCSVCCKFKKRSSIKMLRDQYKFCHNCGAKMDMEE